MTSVSVDVRRRRDRKCRTNRRATGLDAERDRVGCSVARCSRENFRYYLPQSSPEPWLSPLKPLVFAGQRSVTCAARPPHPMTTQDSMDRITETLAAEFAVEYDLTNEPAADQFQHFANLAVVASEYHDSFSPDDVHVGNDSNPGIDGLAVIVNRSVRTGEDGVCELAET